jgi:hypothetical protein
MWKFADWVHSIQVVVVTVAGKDADGRYPAAEPSWHFSVSQLGPRNASGAVAFTLGDRSHYSSFFQPRWPESPLDSGVRRLSDRFVRLKVLTR